MTVTNISSFVIKGQFEGEDDTFARVKQKHFADGTSAYVTLRAEDLWTAINRTNDEVIGDGIHVRSGTCEPLTKDNLTVYIDGVWTEDFTLDNDTINFNFTPPEGATILVEVVPLGVGFVGGLQGPQGIPGEKGEPGKDGQDGRTGQKGDPGKDGTDGKKGDKGDPLTWDDLTQAQKDELTGSDGADGADFTYDMFTQDQLDQLVGPKGDKGDQGDPLTWDDLTQAQKDELTGTDGEDGEDGEDFTYDMFTQDQLDQLVGPKGDREIRVIL